MDRTTQPPTEVAASSQMRCGYGNPACNRASDMAGFVVWTQPEPLTQLGIRQLGVVLLCDAHRREIGETK